MAYTVDDWRVEVRGTIGASETWVNRWTFQFTGSVLEAEAAIQPLLADLYQTLGGFATMLSSAWTAVGATLTSLQAGVTVELGWDAVVGSGSANYVPSQCAIRVSIADALGHNGGPFLAGFTEEALAAGVLSAGALGDLVGALEDFWAAADAADVAWALDRPSEPETVLVARAKVGERFDVIRKRSNDTAERYTILTSP